DDVLTWQECTDEVEFNDPAELFHGIVLDGGLDRAGPACGINQDIYTAELTDNGGGHLLHHQLRRDITAHRNTLAPWELCIKRRSFVTKRGHIPSYRRDVSTVFGEIFTNNGADALGRTGNYRHLAC